MVELGLSGIDAMVLDDPKVAATSRRHLYPCVWTSMGLARGRCATRRNKADARGAQSDPSD